MQLENALVPPIGAVATQNAAQLQTVNALVPLIGMPSLLHAAPPQLDNAQHAPPFGMLPRLDAVLTHQGSADAQLSGTLLNLNAAPIKQDSALVILIGMP